MPTKKQPMKPRFDAQNANIGTPRGKEMMRASLEEVGAGRSVLVDKHGRIIAGNKTFAAWTDIGKDQVEVIHTDGSQLVVVQRDDLDLDDPHGLARKLAYYDNRVNELDLQWDASQVLKDIDGGLDLSAMWDTEELDSLLATIDSLGGMDTDTEPPEPQIDKSEELREQWGVELGQVWELGKHRVVCGDCTYPENMHVLMGEDMAHAVFTDPPYGVDYDGGALSPRKKLSGDATTDLYGPTCQIAMEFSDDKAPLYLWHAGIKGIAAAAAAAAAAAGYEIRCEIIWNKNQAQFGALSAQYKQKHEPCYYCFKKGTPPRWHGPTNEVTVWDVDRASVNEFHPTQKPVLLAERAIRNSSDRNDIVLDLYLGSGATLIACERLNRECRGIEIDPGYVAVTLQRWADLTGETPRLLEAG